MFTLQNTNFICCLIEIRQIKLLQTRIIVINIHIEIYFSFFSFQVLFVIISQQRFNLATLATLLIHMFSIQFHLFGYRCFFHASTYPSCSDDHCKVWTDRQDWIPLSRLKFPNVKTQTEQFGFIDLNFKHMENR